MHPRIAELVAYIDAQHEVLRTAFESVPVEQRGVRPTPDRWSPAEVVHHLTIVERRLAQRLADLVAEARAMEPERDTTSLFPMPVTTKVATRNRRFTTSELGEPRDTDPSRVWEEFENCRQELKQVIASGDGLQLGNVHAPHPALGPFSAYEWIAFAGAHAARHADQIREMSGNGT